MGNTVILTETEYRVALGLMGIKEIYGFISPERVCDDDEIKASLFSLSKKGLLKTGLRDTARGPQEFIGFTTRARALKNLNTMDRILTVDSRSGTVDDLCIYIGDEITCIRYRGSRALKVYVSGCETIIECLEDMGILPEGLVSDDCLYKEGDIAIDHENDIPELIKNAFSSLHLKKPDPRDPEEIAVYYLTTAGIFDLIIELRDGKYRVYEFSKKKLSELLELIS